MGVRKKAAPRSPESYAIPVPVQCLGRRVPDSFEEFFEAMIPNMQYVLRKTLDKRLDSDPLDVQVMEIINYFWTYMARNATERNGGMPIWTRYNPEYDGGGIQYYQWFLKNLEFARRDYARKIFERRATETSFSPGDVDDTFTGEINLDTFDPQADDDSEGDFSVRQVEDFLRDLPYRNPFSLVAGSLLVAQLECPTAKELAKEFGVSMATISAWRNQLADVVRAFYIENDPLKARRLAMQ